jgi:hypothetical protein
MAEIDMADVLWPISDGVVTWTHGVVYGPRALPVWVRIDGEWELQVRCSRCFNVLNDEAASTPIGRVQDLTAPMTIQGTTGTYVYHGAFTRYDR